MDPRERPSERPNSNSEDRKPWREAYGHLGAKLTKIGPATEEEFSAINVNVRVQSLRLFLKREPPQPRALLPG